MTPFASPSGSLRVQKHLRAPKYRDGALRLAMRYHDIPYVRRSTQMNGRCHRVDGPVTRRAKEIGFELHCRVAHGGVREIGEARKPGTGIGDGYHRPAVHVPVGRHQKWRDGALHAHRRWIRAGKAKTKVRWKASDDALLKIVNRVHGYPAG